MNSICFQAVAGDNYFDVEITDVTGTGGLIHLYINRFYIGYLNKRGGEWELLANKPNELTSDDIQILGKIYDETKNPPQ